MVLAALLRHPLYMSAALPLRHMPPLFNRYEGGEHYGLHVDGAIRSVPGTTLQMRTDLSCTLFLAGPDEYEGGELEIVDTYGTHAVQAAGRRPDPVSVQQPAPRASGDARRARGVVLLGAEPGARHGAAADAVRARPEHPGAARAGGRQRGGGGAHRALSQPRAGRGRRSDRRVVPRGECAAMPAWTASRLRRAEGVLRVAQDANPPQ